MCRCCICYEKENEIACIVCDFCKDGVMCIDCYEDYVDTQNEYYLKCPCCRQLLISQIKNTIIKNALLYDMGIKKINKLMLRWIHNYYDTELAELDANTDIVQKKLDKLIDNCDSELSKFKNIKNKTIEEYTNMIYLHKEDYQKVKNLYNPRSDDLIKKLKVEMHNFDTESRCEIMAIISDWDERTFKRMYPKSKYKDAFIDILLNNIDSQ